MQMHDFMKDGTLKKIGVYLLCVCVCRTSACAHECMLVCVSVRAHVRMSTGCMPEAHFECLPLLLFTQFFSGSFTVLRTHLCG